MSFFLSVCLQKMRSKHIEMMNDGCALAGLATILFLLILVFICVRYHHVLDQASFPHRLLAVTITFSSIVFH